MPKGARGNDIERQAEIPLNPKDEHWKRIFDKVSAGMYLVLFKNI